MAKQDTTLSQQIYDLAIGEDAARLCRDIPEAACHEQPRNFVRTTLSQAMSQISDGLVNPKTVLPWLLAAIGAPTFMVSLLVPIREALALFPQLIVGSVVRHFAVRKWFWVGGAIAQGLAALAMAAIVLAGFGGTATGWGIIVLLTLLSLARGVSSVASKDTLGKTVSKNRRGRVSGYATLIGGIVTACVGAAVALIPELRERQDVILALIAAGGAFWIGGGLIFAGVEEVPGATEGGVGLMDSLNEMRGILFRDREFRHFLTARILLLSSALAAPIYVSIAHEATGGSLASLGLLMAATGVAGAVSSSIWGSLADRSSRMAMGLGSAIAGILAAVIAMLWIFMHSALAHPLVLVAALFILSIAHAGIRIGRKTQLVDMATSETRAQYTALANTLMGFALLVYGAILGAILSFSTLAALIFLSASALAGTALSFALRNVQE
ncbi:MFS transporter [Parvibaculum sp. MBR-TMA-1.3b-4.2]|jgi:MFS family permease